MHTVHRSDGDYMEYDNTYTGTVTLTYTVKADNIVAARRGLADIAEACADTGIIGMSSGSTFHNGERVGDGYDARLKSSRKGKVTV